MNMADAMANVRNAQSEADEGMDLKTPTAEDQTGLGSDSGYAGSGGSGGSQHMEDVAAGNGKHQINWSARFCLFYPLVSRLCMLLVILKSFCVKLSSYIK